ncbi:MAG: ATP-binding protein [Roseburia sp.]|nr:ATP-binding protein [Roseburia sp.]
MIVRKEYLELLSHFREKNVIKVVTGIRRCGKSTLFQLYQEELLEEGVESTQILAINLEEGEFRTICTAEKLYHYIEEKLVEDRMNYVFLDEIQQVEEFEKAVDWLYTKKNVDLYITGSNAFLLSGELATFLSGRYVQIKMLPLSFREYLSAFPEHSDLGQQYTNYLQNSSFPGTLELSGSQDIRIYLEGIYTSILLKDIMTRRKITDAAMLESVIRFLFDNIGNVCSARKIANTMTSAGKKISVPTVENYISALVDSYILYKAERYDIKGKQYLSTGVKYYVADIGLRYYLLGTKPADMGHILENVVYLELLRRGYEVYVGKMGEEEVDFIAVNEMGMEYYQVALTVLEETTLQRELRPLDAIRDHNPKYLLTMDYTPLTSYNGIKQMNVLGWLKG